jgi:hypothetical protein
MWVVQEEAIVVRGSNVAPKAPRSVFNARRGR